jgi:hypothetical protein
LTRAVFAVVRRMIRAAGCVAAVSTVAATERDGATHAPAAKRTFEKNCSGLRDFRV